MHYVVVAMPLRMTKKLYYSARSSNVNSLRCSSKRQERKEKYIMKLKNVSLRYKINGSTNCVVTQNI